MDIAMVRSILSVVVMGVFIGIWIWAWSGRQRDRFAQAAAIPLDDDEPGAPARNRDGSAK